MKYSIKQLIKAVFKFIINNQYRRRIITISGIYNRLNDEKYIPKIYYAYTGRKLDLNHPVMFNEKLQWLKLYDRNPLYTIMADKYLVKEYVASIIGPKHIVPIVGVWDKAEDIDFETLPKRFVLKCNHNSGLGMYICKDKSQMNVEKVKKELSKGLAQDYYINNREWVYKNIPRKVIAEKYMEDASLAINSSNVEADGLIDYKFYCFNGKPEFLYVGFASIENGIKHDKLTFLTLDWKIAPFYRKDHEQMPFIPKKPKCLDEMILYAAKLSTGIPFVRVDFFLIDGCIYFSEFTFTPYAGYGIHYPEEWERKLGDMITLPLKEDEII